VKQLKALLRNTWWLWLIVYGGLVALSFVERAALLCIPLCAFVMFYFAFVRYDSEGNHRGS
jgi:hypothetical protein